MEKEIQVWCLGVGQLWQVDEVDIVGDPGYQGPCIGPSHRIFLGQYPFEEAMEEASKKGLSVRTLWDPHGWVSKEWEKEGIARAG